MTRPGAPEALEALLARLVAQAEACPREEVCGLAVGGQCDGSPELWPAENTSEEPARAFRMAPEAVLAALRRADQEGRPVLALYHSHPSGGAALSSRDLDELIVDGAPVLPGVELWVVALEEGEAAEVRAYAWAGAGFAERARRRAPFTL